MYWVYDIETYPNIFSFVFRKVSKDRQIKIFEISSRKNEFSELVSFLEQENLILIGYNNVKFDYPVLHRILELKGINLKSLHKYVQEKIVNVEYSNISPYLVKIPQIDLLKIWHYDNKARMTSLKWLEFSLNWYKVQDLPFKPSSIIPEDKFDDLIEYNINDVDFTYEFFQKSLNAIQFRVSMSQVLNHDVMNYSDVKIGEYLNRVTYEKLSGVPYINFKNLQTERDIIEIKDLIPDFIKFETSTFQSFLEDIRKDSINANTKGDWERHISIGDMNIKFAKGGLHSEDEPGARICKPGYYLKEKDVGSMYPKAIIAGNYYPEHLGEDWNRGIAKLYYERADELKPALKKLKKGSPDYNFIDNKQAAYKLAMNGGGYGKTGSDFGWQKDKLVMFKVTFRGQLSLLMLLEKYYLLGGVELISANTDGIVIHYPKELDDKVQEIHDEWEKITDSILEDTFYKQIINRDVNNYIAEIIDKKGNTLYFKYKGCFEIDPDFHKNKSQRIVPIALKEYFINGTPIHQTIKNHKNIYDFCIGRKATGKTCYITVDGYGYTEHHDKVIRYYIKNNGKILYKQLDKYRRGAVNKGFKVGMFMEYFDSDDYNIDYLYYINECRKIINPIEIGTKKLNAPKTKQLDIFDLGA